MKKYRKNFRGYLEDLSAKKPSPGGGSAAALSACIGISLIEKAINYSAKDKKLLKETKLLNSLKSKALIYVDRDGEIFGKVMQSKGERRLFFLRKSNALVADLGKICVMVSCLAKRVESGIKKSIISDFYTGLNFIQVSLGACIYNLKDNSKILGKRETNINVFKKHLKAGF